MIRQFRLGFLTVSVAYFFFGVFVNSPSFVILFGQKRSEQLYYYLSFLPRFENDTYELMQYLFNLLLYGLIGGLSFVIVKLLFKRNSQI